MSEELKSGLRHELAPQLKQGLMLTPALAQSLHMLAMPILELSAYILTQAEENPALELSEYESGPAEQEPPTANGLVYDETAYEESWQRYLSLTGSEPPPHGQAAAPERPELSPALAAREEQSLEKHLRLQLALTKAPAELREAALIIIEHLDEDGYFSLPLPRLAELSGANEQLLEQALLLVQGFDPPGVAARSLSECLRLQIGDEPARELLTSIIAEHLEDVAKNNVRETARALKTGAEEVESAFACIRALHPRPAAAFTGAPAVTSYIVPDILVRVNGDMYQISLNEHLEPKVHISLYYRRLLSEDEEVKQYLQQKLAAAESLIRNIERRRNTIYRLAEIVLERQRGFFARGLAGLAPLTMKEVADEIKLHESTVSRAIAGKYIQTPRGVYEWKFFFPRAYATEAGVLTPAWVKSQLLELIAGEDKARPYSDQQLTDMLAERGAAVARRTVTKYREALGIPARAMRKRF